MAPRTPSSFVSRVRERAFPRMTRQTSSTPQQLETNTPIPPSAVQLETPDLGVAHDLSHEVDEVEEGYDSEEIEEEYEDDEEEDDGEVTEFPDEEGTAEQGPQEIHNTHGGQIQNSISRRWNRLRDARNAAPETLQQYLHRIVLTDGSNSAPMDVDVNPPFDMAGLKEIGNLASWTVSTFKPGCGVEALRDDDMSLFWQSDGPQPHHLNIHFSRLVSIVSIRLYLDFDADESYTPTRITLLAGTGHHDLLPFTSHAYVQPKGWMDVDLSQVGGGSRNELRCFLVQVRIVENHQNGKDTHLRGLKLYARDGRSGGTAVGFGSMGKGLDLDDGFGSGALGTGMFDQSGGDGSHMITEPDWMSEPQLR